MGASSLCTILIPTHNRPDYLARCVRWFSELGYTVVIADSSASSLADVYADRRDVTYIHCPGGFEVYPRKLQLALNEVRTPLVAMCADDDFISPAGLDASAAFLTANAEYAFSQGYAYLYQTFGRRIALWPMVYPFHNNESGEWINRVESAKSTVYYGLNRTEVLRDAIRFVARQDFSELGDTVGAFADGALTAIVARAGKFKRCEVPFAFREYSRSVAGVGGRLESIVSRNIPDYYKNLTAKLMGEESDALKRQRLVRVFAADFAHQILYDLHVPVGQPIRLASWSEWARSRAEFSLRLYRAAMLFKSGEYRPFLKVFSTPDYRRFKTFVLGSEQK